MLRSESLEFMLFFNLNSNSSVQHCSGWFCLRLGFFTRRETHSYKDHILRRIFDFFAHSKRISGFRCRSMEYFISFVDTTRGVPSLYMLKGSKLLTVQIPFAVRRMHRRWKCTYWDMRYYVTFYHELSKPASKQKFRNYIELFSASETCFRLHCLLLPISFRISMSLSSPDSR